MNNATGASPNADFSLQHLISQKTLISSGVAMMVILKV
jgi:hypothetical protein